MLWCWVDDVIGCRSYVGLLNDDDEKLYILYLTKTKRRIRLHTLPDEDEEKNQFLRVCVIEKSEKCHVSAGFGHSHLHNKGGQCFFLNLNLKRWP